MELGLLLLLAVMAVGVASGGGGGGSSGSGGGGGGSSLLPNLQCRPTNRRGRRLFGRPRTVEPPASCRGRDTGRGAALCDEPGDNYPWEAIDNYLRQSSDIVKKRVENTLKASRISAPNSIRRRRSRSTDDVISEDILDSDLAKEKIRTKKHVDSSPGNWEGSGDTAEETATDVTSDGHNVDLTFAVDSLGGSSGGVTPTPVDAKETDEDNIDALVSFFLNNESVGDVTKDVLKDMLKFRQTFVTPGGSDAAAPPPTSADKLTPTPTPTPTTTPTVTTTEPVTDADSNDEQTTNTPSNIAKPGKMHDLRPSKRSDSNPTTTPSVSADSSSDDTEGEEDLLALGSEPEPVAALPEALPLIASPPRIVHFNPPAFPARERVTIGKASPPPRPTTFGPKLEDFTELVYASGGAAQRRPAEAEVPPPTARTTPLPPTTAGPTPDPYTEAACQYWEEVRSPFYAMNTHNEWKTLINMPNYETYIHMEHCMEEKSQGGCADGCRCTQKYTIRYMPVYDTAANGCDVIYRDKFLFPSHCDCRCLPPGYTLFRKPPAPTTPVPEVVEFVEQLPEGWLPERPTGGRKGQVVREEEEEDEREGEDKEVKVEEVEVEVNERRREDGEKEELVKVTEVLEVDEEDKADDAWSPVPSIGSPDKLNFDSRPPGTVVRPQSGPPAERVTPTRAPPPAAIRRHVTVRPRPLLPTSGPQLGSQRPGGRPNTRWQALARRQPGTRSSHRNHLRGPPAPLAGARLRRR